MKLIIEKYLAGIADESEEKKLVGWLLENDSNLNEFKSEIARKLLNTPYKHVDEQKAFELFRETVHRIQKHNKRTSKLSISKYYKYAAILIILLSSIIFVNIALNSKDVISDENIASDLDTRHDPNKNVILTLNDGSIKLIDKDQEELTYVNNQSEAQLQYHEIKIPNGQIFRLVLSDSTVVWLNANTKLKYPKKFIKSLADRSVILEGEAFFEVAYNEEKPFIVNTNGVNVKVLGTKFNISAYDNDPLISTTLVEGSVEIVDDRNNNNSIIIRPNYQASFQKENMRLLSKKVKTSDYTSWIHEKIIFNDILFEELLNKLERFYNVEITNENEDIKRERFSGQFDTENLETVLRALSASYYFDYEINNNLVTIKR